MRVAKSFGIGTWRQCLHCREQFRPPVSLGLSVSAVLFGSFLLVVGVGFAKTAGATDMLTLTFGGVGAAFTFWGIWQIVRWAKTPVGPLSAFAVTSVPPSGGARVEQGKGTP